MDIMNMAAEYIVPLVAVVCFCFGEIIKNFGIKDNWLRLILAIIGVACNAWGAGEISLIIVAQGLVSALAASGLYDFVTALKK